MCLDVETNWADIDNEELRVVDLQPVRIMVDNL